MYLTNIPTQNMKQATLLLFLWLATLPLTAQDGAKSSFALGADISWYSQMADEGYQFVADGQATTCPKMLKAYGLTAARLRVWVNPQNSYNGLDDVVAKAKAIAAEGLDVMVDFHCSDTWADPGQQTVPGAWAQDDLEALKTHLAGHVTDVMKALLAEGVRPRWAQIGNETNNGLLWDTGKASDNPQQYAQLVEAGYQAVKAACPETQVIVHLSNGFDQGLFDWNLGLLADNDAHFDLIGMSLYPGNDDQTAAIVNAAIENIRHLRATFGKQVMVVEVGLPVNADAEGKTLMKDILTKAAQQTDGACAGVFYWEPEAFPGWNHYQMGAATVSGNTVRFNATMDAFRETADLLSIGGIPASAPSSPTAVYDLQGRPAPAERPGLHIVRQADGHTVKTLQR